MDALFKDISANNVPTPPTQTTGPQPAQTTGPNNEFEELLSRSTQKLYPGCDMTTLEFTSEISHIKMACVTPRSHGGDAGGSPPRRPTRPVPAQCQSSMLRIEMENRSLRKAFRENNEQPLKIGFDYEDLGTFHPLGNFSGMLNSLMGETVWPLPLACEKSTKGITRTSLKRGGRGTQIRRLANLKPQKTSKDMPCKIMLKPASSRSRPIKKYWMKHSESVHNPKGILLRRVKIEDDGNVMKSLCRMIAKAFTVFGGENGWPELFTYIRDFLEEPTSAILLKKLLEEPLTQDTQFHQVKHILSSRVLIEDDGNNCSRGTGTYLSIGWVFQKEVNKEKETTREEGQHGNSASISAATGISDLGQDLEEEIASHVELAKAYMGSRPSKAALRQDLVMHNNATGFLKSPNTLIASKIANGFTTPRSRGRLPMYNMAHTPYARSPSTFTEKGITSSYGREEALTSSQSAFQHGGKMCFHALCLALKRISSILDDDIRLGGPLRRIRQKANLLMLRDKRELGYTTLQQPDHASQKLLLMNESYPKIALRSLEKVDSPKLLSYPHDNQKSEVQHHQRLHDSRELTSKGKEKVEENGPWKFRIKFRFL
ncbi:hypothetical protein Tco_0128105 [Tanacetum coccineum]